MTVRGTQKLRAEPLAGQARATDRRSIVESLMTWADLLAPAEQSLVRCAYDWGVRSREISLLTGRSPRVIRRRMRRLLKRIRSWEFRSTAALLELMPDIRREVARLVILHGLPQRKAAATLGISIHQVRRELMRIEAMRDAAAMLGRRSLERRSCA